MMSTHYSPSIPNISSLPLHFVSIIFLLLLLNPSAAAARITPAGSSGAATTTESSSTSKNSFDFIRASCNATLYPDICFASLSRYATAIQTDPALLAKVAVGVSLIRASRMAAYIKNMTREYSEYETLTDVDPRAISALHDCYSTFEDAIDQMRDSLKQLNEISSTAGGSSGNNQELRFQLNNVQTWMSSAMTNEDSCSDGFQDVKDGPVKYEVCGKVSKVTKFTSNALALVNSYANSLIY